MSRRWWSPADFIRAGFHSDWRFPPAPGKTATCSVGRMHTSKPPIIEGRPCWWNKGCSPRRKRRIARLPPLTIVFSLGALAGLLWLRQRADQIPGFANILFIGLDVADRKADGEASANRSAG